MNNLVGMQERQNVKVGVLRTLQAKLLPTQSGLLENKERKRYTVVPKLYNHFCLLFWNGAEGDMSASCIGEAVASSYSSILNLSA